MRLPEALFVLALLGASSAVAQERSVPPPPAGETPPRPTAPASRPGRLWSITFGPTAVYDTNVDHDRDARPDKGMALTAGLELRNRPSRPSVLFSYETALYRYRASPQWNRMSHHFNAAIIGRIGGRLRVEPMVDVSLKGASPEDRELFNQFAFVPRAELRLAAALSVRAYGAARLKRYPAPDRPRDAFNLYGGADLRLRIGTFHLEAGSRYENNDARTDKYDFVRWTHGAEASTRLGRLDRLGVAVRYRDQHYPFRLLRGPSGAALRHDERWIPSAAWEHRLDNAVSLEVDYRYDVRTSNDPDREYRAHLVAVGVFWRF